VLGDFAKADREWLDVLLDAIADSADLVAKDDDSSFMNRVTLALRDQLRPTGPDDTPPPKERKPKADEAKPAPKGHSHIRQARPKQPAVKVPESGPMAAMLKKLLGGKD
jgi:PTH1 family peptidyl-tRNA hydrolase